RIMRLPLQAAVEVLQVGDPWCKIKYKDREGYVKSAYLTFEEGIMHSRADADIMRGTTYLQTAPEKKAGLLFKIPAATSVKILERNPEGWLKVEVWGEEGFIPERSVTKGWGLLHN
ncbi:MAG TPA: SH3 domain-containing protein, partial [Clostridia bacterium]|nr:SH3 domain-containing protein [Clostridia bacterium]